ncbi:SpaA isopeptide-forming pilin-related protein [Bifidobacterium aquikefiricola]|uniref:SpaA isopeptide-forming pilin-related protein n=1 Tax=Bifidobacterium aquikefiricola TaxID=3059038 RepID=A0AB39U7N5_9BIFI
MDTKIRAKRVAAVVAAASVALAGFGFVHTANAAANDATITVNVKEDGAASATYTAYLIGEYDGITYDASGNIKSLVVKAQNDPINTAIKTDAVNAGAEATAIDADKPANWVAANWLGYPTSPNTDDTISAVSPYAGNLQAFAQKLAGDTNFKTSNTTATGTGFTSGGAIAGDTISFTALTQGLYLIVDSTAETTSGHSLPIIVGTKAWNATKNAFVDFADGGVDKKPALGVAQLKNDATFVGKTIVGDTNGFNIGDTVDYEVTFPVPAIPGSQSTWTSTITDTFPTALTRPAVTDVEIFVGSDTTDVAGLLPGGSITHENADKLKITGLETLYGEYNGSAWVNLTTVPTTTIPVAAGTIIRIKYSAVINDNAVSATAATNGGQLADNTNWVVYEDPTHTGGSNGGTDNAVAYVFGIDLAKVDKADHSVPLAGATFTVAKASAPATPLTFSQESAGVYEYSPTGSATITSNTGTGRFTVKGLEAGEYIFTETNAPSDYFKVSSFSVTIVPTWDLNTQTVSKVDYQLSTTTDVWLTATDTIVTIGDTKEALSNLPYTGGIGIALFVAVGAAVTIIGVRAHRKSAKAEANATAF